MMKAYFQCIAQLFSLLDIICGGGLVQRLQHLLLLSPPSPFEISESPCNPCSTATACCPCNICIISAHHDVGVWQEIQQSTSHLPCFWVVEASSEVYQHPVEPFGPPTGGDISQCHHPLHSHYLCHCHYPLERCPSAYHCC